MTDKHLSVLCAGRIYCDLIFTGLPDLPVLGQETFADDLALRAGGGAFITAATFAALGLKSSVVATLPSAPFDAVIRTELERAKIDASLCDQSPANTPPQITVATVLNGDRAFLTHQSGAAVPEFSMKAGQFEHLHVGELRTLVEQPELLEKARKAGMTISSDCGWDSELIADGAAMTDLIAQVDIFLPNRSEFEGLVASGLDQSKLPITVVKMGQNGAKIWHEQSWQTVSTKPVEAVDTTGAGDAFNGGFLSKWLAKASVADCLAKANACGAAAVQKVGGTAGLHLIQPETQNA